MPDFRAIVANLRASGKLNGPPVIDHILNPTALISESEHEASPERGDQDIEAMEQNLADMHVDPHDIEDMYGPRVTPVSREIAPAPRVRIPDDIPADRPLQQLLFEWREERNEGVQKGQRDQFDRLLAAHMHRIQLAAQQDVSRRPRKAPACRLNAKQRQRKEIGQVNHCITEWYRSVQ